MGDINSFALQQAEAAAAKLWALGSAPYPISGGALIQHHIEQEVTNTAIAFAIHGRRILDAPNSFSMNRSAFGRQHMV